MEDYSERNLTRGCSWLRRHSGISISLVATAILLAGCATKPEPHQAEASTPALAPGDGRVYFYRTAPWPTEVFPLVKLNGQVVGDVKPHAFFYVDRLPGDYKVETSDAEPSRQWKLSLAKGQSQYVRIDYPGMGVLGISKDFGILILSLPFAALGGPLYNGEVYSRPVFVSNIIGEKEIRKCSYTDSN